MNTLEVIKPGTKVTITCPDGKKVRGKVVQVLFSELGVSYNLSWWSGSDVKQSIFSRMDFELENYSQDNMQKIGFLNAVDS